MTLNRCISLLLLWAIPFFSPAQLSIQLDPWASGFNRPVDVTHCGDSRMFVVEQDGIIWTLDSLGNKLDTFLNIDARVNSTANEQGLLGLAFHPNYAQNGYFFVYYTKNSGGATQVSRFSVKPNSPNEADPNSELFILTAAQPFNNHNGGCIKFGPDGFLYIGLGDGGSGGDPQNNGQKKNTFLGKILRIDVNNSSVASPYKVPLNNPFYNQTDYLPEIWSLGWRNPWRFSFDRLTGDMWVGDVGQVTREEVDFEPAGMGGRNYGWRCYEGTLEYNVSGCQSASNYIGPVFDYDNSSMGCSMTGGFVYRGALYPQLYGIYLNADYCSGRIWATRKMNDGSFSTTQLANLGDSEFSSFGEDRKGELYICMLASGQVRKIKEQCGNLQIQTTSVISPICASSMGGLVSISVNSQNGNVSYAWSNGATTPMVSALAPGNYTVTVTDGLGCTATQTYEIVQQGPNLPSLVAADTSLCGGQNLVLTASGFDPPSVLNWYKNGVLFTTTPTESDVQTLILTPVEGGIYNVQLVDAICQELYSSTINVTVESAIVPLISLSGDTLETTGPCVSCQWLLNGQPIPGATNDFYVATFSGVYSLQINTPSGCSYNSLGVSVMVSETEIPATVRQFKLAPNPTGDTVLLEMNLSKSEHISLSMTDASQRRLFFQTKQTQQLSLPIDLRSAPAGVYFLKIELESGSFVRRIVKQ